jgi:hypothetical protein
LLPVALVPDIGSQDNLALSRDIIDNDIENGLEVSRVCFAESEHSTS